jgi:hypothetical protein
MDGLLEVGSGGPSAGLPIRSWQAGADHSVLPTRAYNADAVILIVVTIAILAIEMAVATLIYLGRAWGW